MSGLEAGAAVAVAGAAGAITALTVAEVANIVVGIATKIDEVKTDMTDNNETAKEYQQMLSRHRAALQMLEDDLRKRALRKASDKTRLAIGSLKTWEEKADGMFHSSHKHVCYCCCWLGCACCSIMITAEWSCDDARLLMARVYH